MHLTFKEKKNGREFLTFYIRPHSAVDSAQWDWGIRVALEAYGRGIALIFCILDQNGENMEIFWRLSKQYLIKALMEGHLAMPLEVVEVFCR